MTRLRVNTERFWAKVDRRGPDECWPWLKGKFREGYGAHRIARRQYRAHRVAFYIAHGYWPIPECLHTCDNPPCCNPAHLYEGTTQDNTRDRVARGRSARRVGESSNWAKLTNESIAQIKTMAKAGSTHTSIAKEFGISRSHVGRIVSGKRWLV